jgi:hypothetical protein
MIWIDLAVTEYIGTSGATPNYVLDTTEPVVVYLPNEVCVSFKLRRNTLGGETVICFEKESRTKSLIYTEGE